MIGDIEQIPVIAGDVDYIFHTVSITASKMMVQHPVLTIQTSYMGTKNVLDLAVDKKIEGYISKMYKSGDFLVSDYNGGICINRYVGNEKDVVIPEKIDGKNVIKIGLYFERSWDDTSDGIDGSIYFQRNAFYETGVKSIYLPSGLKEIVMYSFYISEKNTLKSIKVSKENPYYLSVNGILFSKKPLKVLCIPGAYYLE